MNEFDRLSATLDYPMMIVTAMGDGERSGCLVGFGTQCSISPIRFCICIAKNNHTSHVAEESTHLAVHFLSNEHRELASLFGEETGDAIDKFENCRRKEGRGGVPLLEDCGRWVVGAVLERFDFGDHVGHLIEVIEASSAHETGQLGFQKVRDFHPGHPV